jgi:hypothetical protein
MSKKEFDQTNEVIDKINQSYNETGTLTLTVADGPLLPYGMVDSAYIKLDWNKVKTVEDVVLILKEIYPNALLSLQYDSYDKLKHLAVDEQGNK